MESQNYLEKRPSRITSYARICLEISKRGTCGRAQVGCLIVKDNRIISTGFNGPLPNEAHCSSEVCDIHITCSRAVHAEVNALAFAAREGIATNGATLYCTYSPCESCAKLMVQAGILELVFMRDYKNSTGLGILKKQGIRIRKVNENSLQDS